MLQKENDGNIFFETLTWICEKLDSAHIQYMITGGSSVGFWGHIRTTMDIDILVRIKPDNIKTFLKNIEKEAYIDIGSDENILSKNIFNIIFNKTSFKIDIIKLNEQDPYEKIKFDKRMSVEFRGKKIYIISPEDLIISKLLWSQSSGSSEIQLKDCKSIYNLNKEKIDKNYILKWSKKLHIEKMLKSIF